ncbi:MAG: DUF5107 domain-containing protein [Ruthenibacterium sp.]
MKFYQDTLTLPGSLPQGVNPQPRFCAKEANQHCTEDGTLRSEERIGYGVACRERTLPYRMQDRYVRSDDAVCVKTIVLENEYLKATFLPSFGGKLWSLFSKDENRELLYVNPVMRPANLANRNAWTSGGIEWNLGHMGHSAFTCDDLHCAKVTAPNGETFLRMYEYEATHAQFLQMDFHLPDGAKQLGMFVNIQNARATDAPLYWWTNTAAKLTEHTRVFSASPEIIYQLTHDPITKIPGFGHCQMPNQPNLPGVDISYPWQIPHSIEYFFQNERTQQAPWEVCIEKDGTGFFERSTQPLFARKMFCWGSGIGGRHWCDYLSKDGCGDYVEIQAGLAPTQLHTAILPANGTVSFTQLFGAFTAPTAAQTQEWNTALPCVASRVEESLSAVEVNRLHVEYLLQSTLPQDETLHRGSAYGALEMARREKAGEMPIVQHLQFPNLSENDECAAWLHVLEGESLPESNRPLPFITDRKWLPFLQGAAQHGNAQTAYQYAVLLAENGDVASAKNIFTQLCTQKNPWAMYACASLEKRDGNADAAAKLYVQAYEWEHDSLDASFAEDAIGALLAIQDYAQAWALYGKIPQQKRTETERLLAAEAAVKLEEFAFLESAFEADYASIREGAVGLADIWYEYKARLAAKEKGITYDAQQITRAITLPQKLNFLMFTDS